MVQGHSLMLFRISYSWSDYQFYGRYLYLWCIWSALSQGAWHRQTALPQPVILPTNISVKLESTCETHGPGFLLKIKFHLAE